MDFCLFSHKISKTGMPDNNRGQRVRQMSQMGVVIPQLQIHTNTEVHKSRYIDIPDSEILEKSVMCFCSCSFKSITCSLFVLYSVDNYKYTSTTVPSKYVITTPTKGLYSATLAMDYRISQLSRHSKRLKHVYECVSRWLNQGVV